MDQSPSKELPNTHKKSLSIANEEKLEGRGGGRNSLKCCVIKGGEKCITGV